MPPPGAAAGASLLPQADTSSNAPRHTPATACRWRAPETRKGRKGATMEGRKGMVIFREIGQERGQKEKSSFFL